MKKDNIASEILAIANLETKLGRIVSEFETHHGLEHVVVFFSNNKYGETFIAHYQNEIRTHLDEWPYTDKLSLSYDGFMYRFISTTIDYVESAVQLYDIISEERINTKNIAFLYEVAILNEAKRGREGKRSKAGLDALQERLLTRLEQIIFSVDTSSLGDQEDVINRIVQTVDYGPTSSEELQNNFLKYIKICNEGIDLSTMISINSKTDGLSNFLLRNYCTYNIKKFNNFLRTYQIANCHNKRRDLYKRDHKEEKQKICELIRSQLSFKKELRLEFDFLIEAIDKINYLNDHIDVKYSFKSWPGLIYWTIMAEAQRIGGTQIGIMDRLEILQNNTY